MEKETDIKPINLELSDSDKEDIILQDYLYKNLCEWINEIVGIPESHTGKPCDISIKEQK